MNILLSGGYLRPAACCLSLLSLSTRDTKKKKLSLSGTVDLENPMPASVPSINLRIIFTFFYGWGKKSRTEHYFVACKNDIRLKCQCPSVKFYWYPDTLAHLYIVDGGFCSTTARGVVMDRTSWPAKPKILSIWTGSVRFANSWVRQ